MQTWADVTTAIHDRLRRSARADRLLVVLRLDQLPADPAQGGAELIETWRWFQNQPGSGAAISVDRCEGGRDEALGRLRALSAPHQVRIPGDLFGFGDLDLNHWRGAGWRPAVVVDARSDAVDRSETLAGDRSAEVAVVAAPDLAVANPTATVRAGVVHPAGAEAAEGSEPRPAPPEVTWRGVGTREDLDAFLGSTVRWAEIPIRRGGQGDVVLAGEDGFQPSLDEVLGVLAQCNKGARLRLDSDPRLRARVLRILVQSGFSNQDLRLAAEPLSGASIGFQELADACPGALLECPLDFLGPVLAIDPLAARALVESLTSQGVGRFLLARGGGDRLAVSAALRSWGQRYDVGNIEDLGGLLEVFREGPSGLTTDFGLATRPRLRQAVDAAMGAAPPVARQLVRRSQAGGSRLPRSPRI
ncbi:hypothetical protein [Engelhardtia mirabilis]|uniref:Uncharacterized protein n=1 Tax=Engelhardtia mirabilis TaxID=2528011 RepID=A0A518BP07_9BACT|nr:hypothetical protein Pla133_38130 [Planctomycetes bacterium Pla133]QDV03037.1 hypothetical protein Pla86_38120 [Planctomycetes bacterium Pla86]